MKKSPIFKSVLILLLTSIVLSGCSSKEEKNTEPEITTIKDSITMQYPGVIIDNSKKKLKYLDEDKVFEKTTKEGRKNEVSKDDDTQDSRYSMTTKDNKINWDKAEKFNEKIDYDKVFSNITIDGRKVTFPMKFQDFGKNFQDFENIPDIGLDGKNPISYKTKDKRFHVDIISEPLEFKKGDKIGNAIIGDDIYNYCTIGLKKLKDGYDIVFVINSISYPFNGQADIRVDDIGIGSTFNEMYEKLGCPSEIKKEDMLTVVTYDHIGENGKVDFRVEFAHSEVVMYEMENRLVKPNVINTIAILKTEIDS